MISKMKLSILFLFFFLSCNFANATQILVFMGEKQKNHLKAYGIAYWVIEKDVSIEWLLNYRGGSFLMPHLVTIEEELMIRGVSYQILTEGQVSQIKTQIANPEVNMEVIQLEKPPKIAGAILSACSDLLAINSPFIANSVNSNLLNGLPWKTI